MSKPKKSEHMSKIKLKGSNLPPLQRLIVFHFAKSEPQTINETVIALSKSCGRKKATSLLGLPLTV